MRKVLHCTDLKSAEYSRLLRYTLEVYTECGITSFPIDCIAILNHYDFKVYSYKELEDKNQELFHFCKTFTDDAFTWGNIIAYNEKTKPERIRFSLMHELGHHVIGLPPAHQSYESYADYFASNLLAPRSVIWHLKIENVKDICNKFQVSAMAANRILEDYKLCRFWEYQQLHKSIRDCFYSSHSSLSTPSAAEVQELPHTEDDNNFFDILRFCRGEKQNFLSAEAQHIHGSDL